MLRQFSSPFFLLAQKALLSRLQTIALQPRSRTHAQHACCSPKWISSASVIVAMRESLLPQLQTQLHIHLYSPQEFQQDYHVLLFKRPLSSSSFRGKLVFPGGGVSKADFDSLTWQRRDVSAGTQFEVCTRPPIYSEMMRRFHREDALHPSVGLRLCALRELFEETGLLLVENLRSDIHPTSVRALILEEKELHHWQEQLAHNASSFSELYAQLGQKPPLAALYDWSNWLTPQKYTHRFDTMFYFVQLDSIQSVSSSSDARRDWKSREVDTLYVGKPAAFLHGSTRSLVPPQIYELGRLCQFVRLNQLVHLARERAHLGCRRWCPVPMDLSVAGQRCTIYFLPGDERYEQVVGSDKSNLTVKDLVSDRLRNRLFVSADAAQLWWDSSVYELGHVTPVTRTEYRKLFENMSGSDHP